MNRDYERRRDLLLLHADSPPPWTPAALSPTLWLGAYEEARGTKAAQPVLVDGACEDVTKWTASALTTKSNQPGGVAGNCMRILNAGAASRYVYQNNVFVTGNRYAIAGWARGDGVSNPRVGIGSIGYEWTGTASNSWQAISGDYSATSGELFLYASGADAHYSEFDSLTLSNISLTSYLPRIGAAMVQATATAMPWAGALGMMFDGDLFPWTGAASLVKCLHDGTAGSLGFAYRPTALKAENRIVATAATAAGNVGVCVSCTNANTIRVRIMNGGGSYDYDSGDVACPIAINNTYTMVLRVASGAGGVSLRVNGTEVISGALTAPSASDPTTGLMLGGDAAGAATNITGYIGQAVVVQRAITAAECAQYETYVAGAGL